MQLKTCIGTKTKEGCGKEKPITDFNLTRKWRENICSKCSVLHKGIARHEKLKINKIANSVWR